MSVTCYLTRGFAANSDNQQLVETISDESLLSVSQTCAVSATTNILANIVKANVSAIYLGIDKNCTVTYGATTMTCYGGTPAFLWSSTSPQSNPLAGNVSSFNVVNASSTDAVAFELRVLTTA